MNRLWQEDWAERPGRGPAQAGARHQPGAGRNPPEIAYWERGEWWLTGDTTPRSPATVIPVSGRLVFKPRLVPVA